MLLLIDIQYVFVMIRTSFSLFVIIGLTVIVMLAALLIYYSQKVINRYKQTLLNCKEEIRKLSEMIKKEKVAFLQLKNENSRMLEELNQANIDRCKHHPLLKRLYDKTCVFPAFSDAEWKEVLLAFESIYPHFVVQLENQYPNISTRDVRICVLSIMNLKPARIAAILNLQSDTLSSYKQKIKKERFSTTEKKTLEHFLLEYVINKGSNLYLNMDG